MGFKLFSRACNSLFLKVIGEIIYMTIALNVIVLKLCQTDFLITCLSAHEYYKIYKGSAILFSK